MCSSIQFEMTIANGVDIKYICSKIASMSLRISIYGLKTYEVAVLTDSVERCNGGSKDWKKSPNASMKIEE